MNCRALGLAILLSLCGCRTADYDRARYNELKEVILHSKNMLGASQADEVIDLLRLQDVPWDGGDVFNVGDQLRIYHFAGFYLEMYVHDRWVAAPGPSLHVDRLNSPKIRMSNYWDNAEFFLRQGATSSELIRKSWDGRPKQ
jgi:hypothetical protein